MELYLTQLLERLIEVKNFPRNQFNIRIQIVSGISGHPATMAACINAVSLSLMQTAIPLTASLVAVCSSEVDAMSRPVTISVNIANPSVSEPTCTKRARRNGDRKNSPLFIEKVSLSSQLLSVTNNLNHQGVLCSRARDLFEVMATQVTSNLS
nr:exosome complex exonuclease RRP46 [Hymenolepis microstoma]